MSNTEKRSLVSIIVGILILATVAVASVDGFQEDFSTPSLDPSWQVIETVHGLGRYSLTDNPGHLRYYLEGSQGSMWGWKNNYQPSGGWRPSLTLIRPFDGEKWNLTAKVNYNLHAHISGGSTGAQGQGFYIALGEGTNDYIYIFRNVDWWYSSNVFYMELVSNGVSVANFKGAPPSVGADGWVRESYWYEITRNGEKITVRFSNDGINYTTAFSALLTEPVTATQRAIIDMNLWNGVGSYVDWDYIQVEPAPTDIQTTTPTITPTPDIGTVPPTTVPPKAVTTPAKFRVGPSVTLRPVTDVIETNQDGIVELFMRNPSLNDVTLHVDASLSVPSGIHVYGEGFAQAVGAGTAAGTFDVPPGTARTIAVLIKADSSARIGSHTISFSGLYYPGDNKDNFQPITLTYPVTVKAASKNPDSPEPSNPEKIPKGAETPKTPGFNSVLAILSIFAAVFLRSRK